MFSCAKMLCFLLCKKQRCCAKMHFCITFCFAKMHFCINKMLQMHLMLCKNIFLHHILLVQKCIFAKQNVTNAFDALQKCIFASNAFWRTFSKGKCSAYIFQRKMFSVHFPKENVQLCKNAFDAKMLCFLLCKKQRCVHFVLLNIFQRKMFSCAKMLCFLLCKKQRCCAKMHFCITFCFAKMHFCINKMLQMHLMLCKNIFLHHILFCKNAFLHQQNVTNAFDAKMHLMPKCILAYIFLWKMFSIHFPKENVQRTFSKGKCSAVQKCCVFCFAKNKDAVQKCIFASHFVLQKCIFASTKCYKCI